jgi:hypothetical protein
MRRVCWLVKELLPSQEGLYTMQLSSQSVSWLSIITYLVSFLCIYWRSLVLLYTQAQNTHHAFLHNAKYFFKSLYYNSGTLSARSCRTFSKCNKVADNNLTQFKFLINVSERKHTDHIHVIKHTTLLKVTTAHFYLALTLNNATIKCEQQCKPKPVYYKNLGKLI